MSSYEEADMHDPAISRRQALQLASLGLTTVAAPNVTAAFGAPTASKPRARACILLYMDGGPSHIDLFDLKPDAPAEIRGPFRSIATSVPGTRVCEHLPRTAGQMHRILQVRSVRHEQLVHDPAVYQMLTGYQHVSSAGGLEVEETDLPHIAAAFAAADRGPAVMPRAVQIPDVMKMQSRILPGQNAGVLGPSFDLFPVSVSREGVVGKPDFTRQADVSDVRLAARSELLGRLASDARSETSDLEARLGVFRRQALEIVASPAVQTAFDLERETPAVLERYGRHRHGRSVLLARRLVEAGTRFVTVYWGNEEQDWADGKPPTLANNPWDTHRNHFPLVEKSLLPRADQALAALVDDLAQRGMLDEVLVVWMGDFGRTPRITDRWASRDHWPHAFTVLLAGAGTRGGAVYGRTDRRAAFVEEHPVTPADLTATIFDTLGLSPATTIRTTRDGAHQLSTGRVLSELFG
jgi:hypothetical protein